MEKNKLAEARARSKVASRNMAFFVGLWVLAVFLGGLRTNGSMLIAGVSFIMTFVSLWQVVRIDKKVASLEREASESGKPLDTMLLDIDDERKTR